MDTKVIVPVLCDCGNGYHRDRVLDYRLGCPACDPALGFTPEERLKTYKILITPPKENLWKIDQHILPAKTLTTLFRRL